MKFATIQIAGIHDLAEAQVLLSAGVDWLGFPLRLPVNREDLAEAEAARVIAALPDPGRAVLITYLRKADAIAAFAEALGTNRVQLHGDISTAALRELRQRRPELYLMKSLVVGRDSSAALLRRCQELSPFVDAFITDTHDPATGADGATGRVHDWSVSAALVRHSPRPVMLAGGLTPLNVGDAIRRVRPHGVDAHTGVEGPDGRKTPERVAAFVRQAREAFAALPSLTPDS